MIHFMHAWSLQKISVYASEEMWPHVKTIHHMDSYKISSCPVPRKRAS